MQSQLVGISYFLQPKRATFHCKTVGITGGWQIGDRIFHSNGTYRCSGYRFREDLVWHGDICAFEQDFYLEIETTLVHNETWVRCFSHMRSLEGVYSERVQLLLQGTRFKRM